MLRRLSQVSTLALLVTLTGIVAACGGAHTMAGDASSSGSMLSRDAAPLGIIVGPGVSDDWLGASWDGSLQRLASNPDALDGRCFALPVAATIARGGSERYVEPSGANQMAEQPAPSYETMGDDELYDQQVAQTSESERPGRGASRREGRTEGHASAPPVVFAAEDVLLSGFDDIPPDAWVILHPSTRSFASTICPAGPTDLIADEIWSGGVMIVRTPAPGAIFSPADAMGPNAELVSMAGWQLVNGQWVVTQEPVLATFRAPNGAESVDRLCADDAGLDEAELLATLWLASELASPGIARTSQSDLHAFRLDGMSLPDQLLREMLDASPEEAVARLDDAFSIVELCASRPYAQLAAAMVFASSDLYAEAAETLNRLAESNPRVGAYWALAATFELRQQRTDAAAQLVRTGTEHAPGSPGLLLLHARLMREAGSMPASAITPLERASDSYEFGAQALYELGVTYEDLERQSDAVTAYQAALSTDPEHFDAATALGVLAYNLGDIEAADDALALAVELAPNDATALNNRAYFCEIVLQSYGEARALYEAALEVEPGREAIWLNYGYLLSNTFRDNDAAREAFAAGLRAAPDHADLLDAIDRLDARPEASPDLLYGTWHGSRSADDGHHVITVTVLPTDSGGGILTVIDRSLEGEATEERFIFESTSSMGSQLLLQIGDDVRAFDFIDDDSAVLFDPELVPRGQIELDRRQGGEEALLDNDSLWGK